MLMQLSLEGFEEVKLSGALDAPLVFVDIETNGLNHISGRVIEVAAIRVENGRITREFNQLIDPETELPQFITSLTGIRNEDLRGAMPFRQIADELHDILKGAIFVAHNVRFDYSFLKQEFKRVNQNFLPKQLCTVKLSRALYPEQRSHKLESLIKRHGFSYEKRHRAYDDALVLWQFIQHVARSFQPEVIEIAVKKQLKQPAMPKNIKPELVKGLPATPGVYIFEDDQNKPLYIGKSINIKKRVLQHFGHDHDDNKEFKIAQTVRHISTMQTGGELEALLLESRLVKEMMPLYNRQLRRTDKLLLVRATPDDAGYLHVKLEEANDLSTDDLGSMLAVYERRSRAKSSLQDLQKTYDLCPKLLGLEKSSAACFLYQLHKCRGACAGHEPADLYNQRLLTAFEHQRIREWPYQGAVLVQEKWGETMTSSGIIVDQWCVIGEVSQQEYCEPEVQTHTKTFDLDTYKILQNFLATKFHKLIIQPLSQQDMQQLGV